ncbi:hypothetical protein HY469_02280 [Candidatus Roizmanbacteria bacterium]|nr:hypothetical protein [Candidatus Roizmanbacteria bacterium]
MSMIEIFQMFPIIAGSALLYRNQTIDIAPNDPFYSSKRFDYQEDTTLGRIENARKKYVEECRREIREVYVQNGWKLPGSSTEPQEVLVWRFGQEEFTQKEIPASIEV